MKIAFKEITSSTDKDGDKMEEFAEMDKAFEKSPEFCMMNDDVFNHIIWYINIQHCTAYFNHYHSENYLIITGPPPDSLTAIV